MPFAPSSVLVPSSKARSFLVASLFLVAMPFAPSSVLVPSSSLFLAVRPGVLVASLFLVAMPFAPSSVLVPVRPGVS